MHDTVRGDFCVVVYFLSTFIVNVTLSRESPEAELAKSLKKNQLSVKKLVTVEPVLSSVSII